MKIIKNTLFGRALIGASLVISCLFATTVAAASLQQVSSFGNNPSNLGMYLFVPDNVPNNAPILVAVHYCHGSATAFYNGSQFSTLATKYGFIVIYPNSNSSDQCFDVATNAALKRDGGSDPVGIMSMVSYVQKNYNVDSTRIYVTGVSSGAMMTNVLLGLYPDVFKAGAAFAGVPFGCFATGNSTTWNSDCANGKITKTAAQWGDIVRAAYPGYSGARPRIQFWHGTNDETLNYVNFGEELKEWTNVIGISASPVSTDTPESGATRTRYGNGGSMAQIEAISLQGVSHNLPVNAAEAIRFFGLDSGASTSSKASSAASVAKSSTPASSKAASSAPKSAATASSTSGTGGERCNWYGTTYPLCVTTTSGWGYENSVSCIARVTCTGQPAPYGVVGGNASSVMAASSSRASVANSSSSIRASVAASSAPVVVSSRASSSVAASGQVCNWYGTKYPLCTVTTSGWGYENQKSCISRTTCSSQPAPYGIQ